MRDSSVHVESREGQALYVIVDVAHSVHGFTTAPHALLTESFRA